MKLKKTHNNQKNSARKEPLSNSEPPTCSQSSRREPLSSTESPAHRQPLFSSASLTRRQALRGAAGIAGTLALGLPALISANGCSRSSNTQNLDVLDVAEDAIVTLDAYTQVHDPENLYKVSDVAQLKTGTQLFSSGANLAAAFMTGETASPLSTAQLVDYAGEKSYDVLPRAISADSGFEIYGAYASDTMLAWVESNYLTSEWKIYAADIATTQNSKQLRDDDGIYYTKTTNEYSIGEAVQVGAGTIDIQTPNVCVIGNNIYWIEQPPADSSSKNTTDSLLKVSAGRSAATTIYTSHGRFNAGIEVSKDILTVMPRAQSSSNVYYQMTAISSSSSQVVATQVLPRSFAPSSAIYMANNFAFCIGASYNYGGGIANVGTYYPATDGKWIRLTRQPVTAPGLCQGWLYSKSGGRTAFVDIANKRYFTVNAPSNAQDYGDYSVCKGEIDALYNYSSISNASTNEKYVQLRKIELVPASS